MNKDKEEMLNVFKEASDLIKANMPTPVMPNDIFEILFEANAYLGLSLQKDMPNDLWEWNRDLSSRIVELMKRL